MTDMNLFIQITVYRTLSILKINFLIILIFHLVEIKKNFSTNIYEAVQVNDLLLTSNNTVNKFGFNNVFKSILKNVNSDGKNSSKFKDKAQSEILGMVSYDVDFTPIKK